MAAKFDEDVREQETLFTKKYVLEWTQADIDRMSIFYDNTSVPLHEFTARVKTVAWKGRINRTSPMYFKEFESTLRKGITFCLPCDSLPRPVNVLETEHHLKLINKQREYFTEFATGMKSQMHLSKSAELEYDFFKTRTYDFLVYLGKFQEIRATCPCKEIQYTNLFMEFSKIFALKPEVGEIRERRIRIGSQTVVCIPDVRFLRYPQIADHSLLVMHTEVNLIKPADDQEETFDIHELTTQTLGLHGGELLAERKFSIFKPGVLGIICLRTKLIFTFMEMTEDHYNCIERGRSCDEHHAKIIYTKPYDYLNEEEREEMYSLLFWLGYLQQCT